MDGVDDVISGAAAKHQDGPPCNVVTPYGASEPGRHPEPIQGLTPDGQPVDAAFVI